jgi:hypothetical protein
VLLVPVSSVPVVVVLVPVLLVVLVPVERIPELAHWSPAAALPLLIILASFLYLLLFTPNLVLHLLATIT